MAYNHNSPVVSSRDEIWLLSSIVVADAVDAFVVALQGVVGHGRAEIPYLNASRN